MNAQSTGAFDKAHPDMTHDNGGVGESGSQRDENDFDHGAQGNQAPSGKSNRDRHADKQQPEEAGPGRASQTPPERGRF